MVLNKLEQELLQVLKGMTQQVLDSGCYCEDDDGHPCEPEQVPFIADALEVTAKAEMYPKEPEVPKVGAGLERFTDIEARTVASECYHDSNDVEFADGAEVHHSADGCWVEARLWVPYPNIEEGNNAVT